MDKNIIFPNGVYSFMLSIWFILKISKDSVWIPGVKEQYNLQKETLKSPNVTERLAKTYITVNSDSENC